MKCQIRLLSDGDIPSPNSNVSIPSIKAEEPSILVPVGLVNLDDVAQRGANAEAYEAVGLPAFHLAFPSIGSGHVAFSCLRVVFVHIRGEYLIKFALVPIIFISNTCD
jgi:hypothetical protein